LKGGNTRHAYNFTKKGGKEGIPMKQERTEFCVGSSLSGRAGYCLMLQMISSSLLICLTKKSMCLRVVEKSATCAISSST